MEILIRKATVQDYKAIWALLYENNNTSANAEVTRNHADTSEKIQFKKYVETLVHDSSTFMLVAVHGETVVGVILASIKHVNQRLIPPTRERSFVLIQYINISQKYRSHGIGKKLMEQTELWAKSNNIEKIELEVFEHNSEVLHFYERLGYRQMKRILFKRVLKNLLLTKDEDQV